MLQPPELDTQVTTQVAFPVDRGAALSSQPPGCRIAPALQKSPGSVAELLADRPRWALHCGQSSSERSALLVEA